MGRGWSSSYELEIFNPEGEKVEDAGVGGRTTPAA